MLSQVARVRCSVSLGVVSWANTSQKKEKPLMKTLMINYEFPPIGGGGAKATLKISSELVRMGVDVYVLTSQFKHTKSIEMINGIEIFRVPVGRKRADFASKPEMFNFILAAVPTLLNLLKREKIDITHAFFGLPSGVLSYFAEKLFHVPYIVRMGGSDVPGFNPYRFRISSGVVKPILLRIWQDASMLVAVSNGLRKLALNTDPDANILVIPNGVDVEEFKPLFVEKNEEDHILFVGRLDSNRKGVSFLLQAFQRLSDEKLPCKLTIIGDGPYRSRLEQLAEDLNLNNIEFLGHIPNAQLPIHYNHADIFVLPSCAEGMSNVILEAMACGLPVVATNVGGNPELVQNGETGFLVPPENVDALYDSLVKLLSDKNLRERMGRSGRKTVEEFFTWDKIAEDYHKLYESILS